MWVKKSQEQGTYGAWPHPNSCLIIKIKRAFGMHQYRKSAPVSLLKNNSYRFLQLHLLMQVAPAPPSLKVCGIHHIINCNDGSKNHVTSLPHIPIYN